MGVRIRHDAIAARTQAGVGLIEVLIAVLVLCFGMLGLIALQLTTLKQNQSALERGLAVVQSHSIIDAMRADRNNALSGGFNIALDAEPNGNTFASIAIAAWRSDLQEMFGDDATGSIDCDGPRCTITVQWNDSLAGGSETETISTEVQL
jgi:type IV pilus assembly protein PilV